MPYGTKPYEFASYAIWVKGVRVLNARIAAYTYDVTVLGYEDDYPVGVVLYAWNRRRFPIGRPRNYGADFSSWLVHISKSAISTPLSQSVVS